MKKLVVKIKTRNFYKQRKRNTIGHVLFIFEMKFAREHTQSWHCEFHVFIFPIVILILNINRFQRVFMNKFFYSKECLTKQHISMNVLMLCIDV